MIARLCIVLLSLSMSRAALSEEVVAPRDACAQEDIRVALFRSEAEVAQQTPKDVSIREIIRSARWCRFRTLALQVFVDDNALTTAQAAAATVRKSLIDNHWPMEAITIDFRSKAGAPNGPGLDQPWLVAIAFAPRDRDPNWHPPLETPALRCDASGAPPRCRTLPWPAPKAVNIDLVPPALYDPPSLFFDANSAALSADARAVTRVGARIFTESNYLTISLTGYCDGSEPNCADLAKRRALVVRDALVVLGIDSSAIGVIVGGVRSTYSGQMYVLNRCVSFDFSD